MGRGNGGIRGGALGAAAGKGEAMTETRRPFPASGDFYGWLSYPYPDSLHNPYAFDRVEIAGAVSMSLLGTTWSEYPSGPNLCLLAGAAAKISGQHGYFGLASCRKLGFGAKGAERKWNE